MYILEFSGPSREVSSWWPLGPVFFLKILHYRGIGVFWPKIPLNLTSEGLKYPQEVRVQHETCSTICGTPVQAILDQKKLTGLAGGGQGRSKYCPKLASLLALEPSRGP